MSAVRWDRERAVGPVDPLAVDALGEHSAVVLDGVTSADDESLGWCRWAPCVVIGCAPEGAPSPAATDLVLVGADVDRHLDGLLDRITEQPAACRVLVDVLRMVQSLTVPAGLVVESLAYSALLAGPAFGAWLAGRERRPPRRFDHGPVRVERTGDELRIVLARPENRNAFSAAMRDGLFEALSLAVVDRSIERVVLAGEGPTFSSGGDLDEFGTAPDPATAHAVRTRRSVGRLLHGLGARVAAEVQGSCVGAGAELSAFAGHVVADPASTFRLPEIAMGLIPGAGGTVSLSRRIGRQETGRLAISGVAIGADEALRLGLVDEIAAVG